MKVRAPKFCQERVQGRKPAPTKAWVQVQGLFQTYWLLSGYGCTEQLIMVRECVCVCVHMCASASVHIYVDRPGKA